MHIRLIRLIQKKRLHTFLFPLIISYWRIPIVTKEVLVAQAVKLMLIIFRNISDNRFYLCGLNFEYRNLHHSKGLLVSHPHLLPPI